MPPPPPGPVAAQPAQSASASSAVPSAVGSSIADWPRPLPAWLNRTCAKHIVKGNFMTLSARPKTVEQGEWIAHQGELNFPNGLMREVSDELTDDVRSG